MLNIYSNNGADKVQWFDGKNMNFEQRNEFSDKFEKYYLITKIFGTVFTFMMLISLSSFGYNILNGEWFSSYEGTFVIAGYISAGVSLMFMSAILYGAFKLMRISDKVTKKILQGDFQYHIGCVTDKRSTQKHGKYICVDDVECHCISTEDYINARLGSCFIIINLNNSLFATGFEQNTTDGFF